jgi:excinuclease ABC subunit B
LRRGDFDALIGVNLLREGLDLPEVTRVAILDADKEGFLRSETSLVQTAGRCARNTGGKVILYADEETPAITALKEITRRHREKQEAYNAEHGIVPRSVKRAINEDLQVMPGAENDPAPRSKKRDTGALKVAEGDLSTEEVLEALRQLETEMRKAAEDLEFERAALLRDEMRTLRKTYGLN